MSVSASDHKYIIMGTTENIETSCTMLIQGMWYSGLTLCCVWASENQHLGFSKRLIIVLHETKTGSHGSIYDKSKPPLRAKIKLAEWQHLYLRPRAENRRCRRWRCRRRRSGSKEAQRRCVFKIQHLGLCSAVELICSHRCRRKTLSCCSLFTVR